MNFERPQGRAQGDQRSLTALKLGIGLTTLDAVAVGPVPLEWVGMVILILAGFRRIQSLRLLPLSLIALLAWAVLVHLISQLACATSADCSGYRMPPLATTSYGVFIALRFFVVLAFIAALMLTLRMGPRRDELVAFVLKLGTAMAGLALYIYVAQLTGLPDIPRTRVGTDGEAVTHVSFTFAFHRALGTFREPSYLAAWLVLPFFLSLRKPGWRSLLIGLVILLTGSLTGFVALVFGAIAATIYLPLRGIRETRWLVRTPLVIFGMGALALLLFGLFVSADLGAVVAERVMPILKGGMIESNRGYVFEYMDANPIPFIGHGLGNATLVFTKWMGFDATGGFLSLYINILYSLGLAGFALLLVFLAKPLLHPIRGLRASDVWPLLAAYFAWLVIFSVHAAELPAVFAIIYGLILGLARQAPAWQVASSGARGRT